MHLLMLSLRGSTGICGAFDFSKTFWIKIPTTWPPKQAKSAQRSPLGTCDDVIWFLFAPHKKIKHFYFGAQTLCHISKGVEGHQSQMPDIYSGTPLPLQVYTPD